MSRMSRVGAGVTCGGGPQRRGGGGDYPQITQISQIRRFRGWEEGSVHAETQRRREGARSWTG